MRIARVLGHVTLSKRHPALKPGSLLLVEACDHAMLTGAPQRAEPMPQSLVVYDALGAGTGHTIAISEGGEATAPFLPDRVPVDAYVAALLDTVHTQP